MGLVMGYREGININNRRRRGVRDIESVSELLKVKITA